MARETIGQFTNWTSTMAWNYTFGSLDAFEEENHRLREAGQATQRSYEASLQVPGPELEFPEQRKKRAAASVAWKAWEA
jgi:hypothetical protein